MQITASVPYPLPSASADGLLQLSTDASSLPYPLPSASADGLL